LDLEKVHVVQKSRKSRKNVPWDKSSQNSPQLGGDSDGESAVSVGTTSSFFRWHTDRACNALSTGYESPRYVPLTCPHQSNTDLLFDAALDWHNNIVTCKYLFSHLLDSANNICLHHTSYSKCAKCKGKQVSNKINDLWLLDSGASFHFINNMNDFAEYTPLKKPVYVTTATSTTRVIGVGTVILNYESEVVRLALVYYIPELNCQLISMGTLLRDGMTAQGNAKRIDILTEPNQVSLCLRTCQDSDTIYCVKLLPNNEQVAYSVSLASDYQTWHRRFAHPLRDVLKYAQKHTEGFNQIEFPHKESIYQGCTQGKIPLQAFPENPKRASRLFELIHSI
jgi:hypothetical protein